MESRNYADVIAGAIVAVFGLAIALYAAQVYSLGTLRRMGPGMFPMALGLSMAFLGAALALVAWLKPTGAWKKPDIQWLPAVLVLIGVVAFAVLIQTAGLFPAVIAVVGISAFADERATIVNVAVLSAILCLMAFMIFRLGLGMSFRLLEWPF
jgi:hypothetical protein